MSIALPIYFMTPIIFHKKLAGYDKTCSCEKNKGSCKKQDVYMSNSPVQNIEHTLAHEYYFIYQNTGKKYDDALFKSLAPRYQAEGVGIGKNK